MLPTLPETWMFNEKVPFSESNVVEFKEVTVFEGLFTRPSHPSSGLPKYRETLIGFLNGGKGYLFMGIRDDGIIRGVTDLTDSRIDFLKLWIDSTFNVLIHKNGEPLNPSETSIKLYMFPVEGSPTPAQIICIEAIHKGALLDIMTSGGTMIYRLNASNYKICSEPVYRKRDVKGIINSIQTHMQEIINGQNKTISEMQKRHAQEMKDIVEADQKKLKDYVAQISDSLYTKYKLEGMNESLCSRILKCLWFHG